MRDRPSTLAERCTINPLPCPPPSRPLHRNLGDQRKEKKFVHLLCTRGDD